MTVHLMVRSCYTMLGSTIRLPELVKTAKELGYDSLALTDRNVMHGTAAFSHLCEAEGIKPIFGLELDVEMESETVPFLLLAETNQGFTNLMRLSSEAEISRKPVPFSFFLTHLDGLFVIVYGEGGYLEAPLIQENREGVLERLRYLKAHIPEFDAALSYQDAGMWRIKNQLLKECARALNIPVCPLNKIVYLKQDDAKLYRTLSALRTSRSLNDSSLPLINGRYLLSKEEMAALYTEEELKRTDEIAAMCTASCIPAVTGLPSFPLPEGITSDQYLTKLAWTGLIKRLNGQVPQKYLARLKYELDIINRMKFSDYFLIVYDFIRYARKQGIMVGPGRGSAAGSLVSWSIGITMIDPIRYDLLFERFLNPERVSMPDIDTDIPDDRRDEVIAYVRDQYGEDHVAGIVTFNTLGAKQVLRDLGKAMGIPVRDIDMLVRMIPNTQKTTLRSALKDNPKLLTIVKAEERYQELFRTAVKLEGLPRHKSVHPAGVVLSSKPLSFIVPLAYGEGELLTSQLEAEYLEERGLIKMDFLSLRNLTMIDAMVKRIRETEPDFDILAIPLDDQPTFDIFRRADTNGIFQFESDGMKSLLKRIHPDSYGDITASLALYRPASKDSIPQYLRNKEDPSRIVYPSRELEPVLKESYGVMIYQEQSMKTAEIAAGFTLAEADILRKAMSKKKEQELLNMKERFLSGCRKNGYSEETASMLFELVQRFGGYGFNKSHAVAYGLVAWQTAYIKARYPLIFYSCLMDSLIGDSSRISMYVDECRRRRIQVFGPDVNRSKASCTVEANSIRLPLSAVKSVGVHAAEAILSERERAPFEDFFDFVARVLPLRIPRSSIEALIDAGALDCFFENRSTMKNGLDEAIAYSELIRIESGGQIVMDPSLVSKPVLVKMHDQKEMMREREMEVLGFTLGAHPIIEKRTQFGIEKPSLISFTKDSGFVSGFGYVSSYKTHQTKKGEKMAFMTLNDETADLEVLVMPKQYAKYESMLRKGMYVLFDGKMTEDGKCIANTLTAVS
ncbi:MAG: DNA polymerase III subunit alpha [Solobacterium sp.]|nr:DNA polymerase III subunit alpha [Solobacterium sp.]